jgi:TolA-binding protein
MGNLAKAGFSGLCFCLILCITELGSRAEPPQARIRPQPVNSPAQPAPQDSGMPMEGMIQQLGKLGELASQTQEPRKIVFYNLQQADLLTQIVKKAKADERGPWIRQMADCLNIAVVYSPAQEATARVRLANLEQQIKTYVPGTDLDAYVTYRDMEADYFSKLNAAGTNTEKVQDEYRLKLYGFVQHFPHSEDTPTALYELGTISESKGKVDEARLWFYQVAQNFPRSPLASKADRMERRLALEGRTMDLTLPILTTDDTKHDDPYDIDTVRGNVVVLYCWSADEKQTHEDFAALDKMLGRFQSKGVRVVCINMDKTPAEGRAFLGSSPGPGVQVFQRGGIDGLWAKRHGILTAPTLVLVGRDGKVAKRTLEMSHLEDEVQKLLK